MPYLRLLQTDTRRIGSAVATLEIKYAMQFILANPLASEENSERLLWFLLCSLSSMLSTCLENT